MTRSLTDLLPRPVVVAPMAGGPSTTELVIAAARAGALGFLAAGYKTAEAMTAEIAAVRAATGEPFGVNVFVPGTPYADPGALDRYLSSLRIAGPLGDGTWDDDGFDSKVATLLTDPPPVTSFTFGCPRRRGGQGPAGRGHLGHGHRDQPRTRRLWPPRRPERTGSVSRVTRPAPTGGRS